MRLHGLAIFVSILFLTCGGAQAQSCADLSYQRNLIYKRAGYCFKTAAQIRIFGNAGCQYDDQADVPLSARDRAAIADIVNQEANDGCR